VPGTKRQAFKLSSYSKQQAAGLRQIARDVNLENQHEIQAASSKQQAAGVQISAPP
jgi:hypothetical protein